jgi:polar amino acid transport system substrate-binding protein
MKLLMRRRVLLAMLCLTLSAASSGAEHLTAVTEEFRPLNYTDNGVVRGYTVDIVRELLARAKIDYSLGSYPWARAYQMAQRQPDVLIFSIVRTPEREKLFQWIAPVAKRHVYIYKMARRRDIQLASPADLFKYMIASDRDDVSEAQLEALGLKTGKNIELSNQDSTSLQKLLIGRVDLMVATESSMQELCERQGIPYGDLARTILLPGGTDYYIAASLNTAPQTVDLLREEFRKMRKSDFLRKVAEKYNMPQP